MKYKLILTLAFWFCTITILFAQINENVNLFGTLDPEPIRYSGSFGYIDSNGNEYALLGAHNNFFAISIDDSTNIYAIDSVQGPGSNWREIAVIGNYAYVVTEGGGPGQGMQVIDLSYLPDSLHLLTTFDSTFNRVHMVQKNFEYDSTYIYLAGTTPGDGVHIIDISNPANPVEISRYDPYYIHDIHVRGNRMYASAIYNGTLDIVDITDRTSPVLLNQISYPSAFTHSAFTTEDHTHLMVTDEKDSLPARIWNIEDLSNVTEVSQYSGNLASLVHNPYIKGDFAFVSHNTEGLRVIDITKPDVPVEVGYYDTYTGPSGGFSGLWSAFPFFPSNKIIGGNREDGLYVWKFNNTYAGRIYGLVIDSLTGAPLISATVNIQGTGSTILSDLFGNFKIGELPSGPGGYTLEINATGYQTKIIPNIVLNSMDSIYILAQLNAFVGIGETGENPSPIIVYNLNLNDIIVNLSNQNQGNFTFELYNQEGKLVFHKENMNSEIHHLNVNNLSKGLYLYKMFEKSKGLYFSNKINIQ